jgi:hypothetical protein
MFLTEEQSRARLNSPDNLANMFNINRDRKLREERYAKITEGGISERETQETQEREQTEESRSQLALSAGPDGISEYNSNGITHKKLGHAGRIGPRLSIEERTEIAIATKTSGLSGKRETQEEIAKRYGISRQGVAEIASLQHGHGAINKVTLDDAMERARERALDKLMLSLGLITEDKLADCSANQLSAVAARMAQVVEKTIPDANRNAAINLIVYSPEIRKESSFNVVEVS